MRHLFPQSQRQKSLCAVHLTSPNAYSKNVVNKCKHSEKDPFYFSKMANREDFLLKSYFHSTILECALLSKFGVFGDW